MDSTGHTETTLYVGAVELVTSGTNTIARHRLSAYGEDVLTLAIGDSNCSTTMESICFNFIHGDQLGGVDAVTDVNGNTPKDSSGNPLAVSFGYNAFGGRRDPVTGAAPTAAQVQADRAVTHRGFTKHEMLDNLNLIHMNGRVQDPYTGRFVSADPTVPDPFYSQSFNRFAYVCNNPMNAVDPSGFEDLHLSAADLQEFNPDGSPKGNWRTVAASDSDYQDPYNSYPVSVQLGKIEVTKANEGTLDPQTANTSAPIAPTVVQTATPDTTTATPIDTGDGVSCESGDCTDDKGTEPDSGLCHDCQVYDPHESLGVTQCTSCNFQTGQPDLTTLGGSGKWAEMNQNQIATPGKAGGGGPKIGLKAITGSMGFPTGTAGPGHSVIIRYPNGNTEWRVGGSRSWRNNNPGNIRPTNSNGSIGSAGGFAVYPSASMGRAALQSLLSGPHYRGLSVNVAIAKYAPSNENNTEAYQSYVNTRLGISGSTPISSLSGAQFQGLINAIIHYEGWSPGIVGDFPPFQ